MIARHQAHPFGEECITCHPRWQPVAEPEIPEWTWLQYVCAAIGVLVWGALVWFVVTSIPIK